jgi:glutamine---fructose-6-phosphate transaminase (isomerizing)
MSFPTLVETRCKACILPVGFPGLSFNSEGLCSLCSSYTPGPQPLGEEALLKAVRPKSDSKYDCVVPLSGGKDSSYVLYHAVRHLGLKPIAVNYNSGFQSLQATKNIVNACKILGVPLKVFHGERALRLGLIRQVLKIACLTGSPTGVCGNCETAIRYYSILTAKEEGVKTILFGDSATERLSLPVPKGVRRILRHVSLVNLSGLTKAICSYFIVASRERKLMGIPMLQAFRPSMAPIPFPEPEVRVVHFFDYVRWETMNKQELLAREIGWQATGNRMDRFDCFLHPLDNLAFLKETGISKDGYIYANLVREGIMNREQALSQEMDIQRTVGKECLEFVREYGLEDCGTNWVP